MMRTLRTWPLVFVAAVLAAAALIARSGVTFNFTASLPIGVYRDVDAAVERRRIVRICLPSSVAQEALERGYIRRGGCPSGVEPVGKLVVAVAGDRVAIGDDGLAVNGELLPGTAPLRVDSAGRRMPRLRHGARPIAPVQMAVVALHPRSYDSRYFGPVPASAVVAVMEPLLTFEETQ